MYDFDTKKDLETAKRAILNYENYMRVRIETYVYSEEEQAQKEDSLEKRRKILEEGVHIFSPDEFEFVDLGLPSGTLWAKENAPVKGGYCPYQMARFLIPKMLPTKKQFMELLKECKWTPRLPKREANARGSAVVDYLVEGKNGNSIILPATGYYNSSENEFYGIIDDEKEGCRIGHGHYWSSTEEGLDSAATLYFNSDEINPLRTMSHWLYLAVRPVTKKS